MDNTWILVADRARARLFALRDENAGLQELATYICAEGRLRRHELESDRPPSTHDRFGPGRHAIEPHTPVEDKEAGRFAQCLEQVLARGHAQRRYRNLVLVAPPRFLGVLRSTLDGEVRDTVVSELARELVETDPPALLASLPPEVRAVHAAR